MVAIDGNKSRQHDFSATVKSSPLQWGTGAKVQNRSEEQQHKQHYAQEKVVSNAAPSRHT